MRREFAAKLLGLGFSDFFLGVLIRQCIWNACVDLAPDWELASHLHLELSGTPRDLCIGGVYRLEKGETGSREPRWDPSERRQSLSFWSLFCVVVHVSLEKAMATHSSTLAWRIPWMEEAGRLWSMGSQRVWHYWATLLSLFTFMHWRRKWQPTPVFLPRESQGWGSLVGCCLMGSQRVGHDWSDLAAAAARLSNTPQHSIDTVKAEGWLDSGLGQF